MQPETQLHIWDPNKRRGQDFPASETCMPLTDRVSNLLILSHLCMQMVIVVITLSFVVNVTPFSGSENNDDCRKEYDLRFPL